MKLGFFGGAFNPPSIAHYNLIRQALEIYNFDEVYFVPVNDYYKKRNLVSLKDRINMLELMIKSEKKIKVFCIDNVNNLHTIDTLEIICNRFPKDEVIFFMGEDNFYKMPQWKDFEKLKKYHYIVFQRNDKYSANIELPNVIYMKNSENIKISSTLIRHKLSRNESISNLVNSDVEKYIKENKIYIKED